MQNDVRRTYRTYDDTFFYTIIVHTSLGLTFSLKAFLWQYDLCSVRTSKNGEKSSHPDVLWVLSLFPRSFQIPVQFYLTFRKKIAKFWFRQSLQKNLQKKLLTYYFAACLLAVSIGSKVHTAKIQKWTHSFLSILY